METSRASGPAGVMQRYSPGAVEAGWFRSAAFQQLAAGGPPPSVGAHRLLSRAIGHAAPPSARLPDSRSEQGYTAGHTIYLPIYLSVIVDGVLTYEPDHS